ncbi:phosphoadenosine phosphosulfate reductase family protein [Lentisphaera profundi]|uniref:Phosphoadenosine phosphosulfate reductase family protein n=1 Tax=Lentisphaera profundi TaxID=1658616 RepID=A0ABY7VU47_9BACT|nr:phosphoadenosine phosphosulfate reductase family protein [Lentisphaera profundi]WDE97252.1 phosphoadenosine phosphosulfate reductase family protein [Lentisphaera profundi]
MNIDIEKLNAEMRHAHPSEIIKKAIEIGGDRPMVSTNFRPLEAVVLDMATKVKNDISIVWVDSGFMMPQTYAFAEKTIQELKLNINVFVPKMTAARFGGDAAIPSAEQEEELAAFADIFKLEPFRRALTEVNPSLWFTSLRQEQNQNRAAMDIFDMDSSGMLKCNPVFYWSESDMETYIEEQALPDEQRYFDPTKPSLNHECGLHKSGFLK